MYLSAQTARCSAVLAVEYQSEMAAVIAVGQIHSRNQLVAVEQTDQMSLLWYCQIDSLMAEKFNQKVSYSSCRKCWSQIRWLRAC